MSFCGDKQRNWNQIDFLEIGAVMENLIGTSTLDPLEGNMNQGTRRFGWESVYAIETSSPNPQRIELRDDDEHSPIDEPPKIPPTQPNQGEPGDGVNIQSAAGVPLHGNTPYDVVESNSCKVAVRITGAPGPVTLRRAQTTYSLKIEAHGASWYAEQEISVKYGEKVELTAAQDSSDGQKTDTKTILLMPKASIRFEKTANHPLKVDVITTLPTDFNQCSWADLSWSLYEGTTSVAAGSKFVGGSETFSAIIGDRKAGLVSITAKLVGHCYDVSTNSPPVLESYSIASSGYSGNTSSAQTGEPKKISIVNKSDGPRDITVTSWFQIKTVAALSYVSGMRVGSPFAIRVQISRLRSYDDVTVLEADNIVREGQGNRVAGDIHEEDVVIEDLNRGTHSLKLIMGECSESIKVLIPADVRVSTIDGKDPRKSVISSIVLPKTINTTTATAETLSSFSVKLVAENSTGAKKSFDVQSNALMLDGYAQSGLSGAYTLYAEMTAVVGGKSFVFRSPREVWYRLPPDERRCHLGVNFSTLTLTSTNAVLKITAPLSSQELSLPFDVKLTLTTPGLPTGSTASFRLTSPESAVKSVEILNGRAERAFSISSLAGGKQTIGAKVTINPTFGIDGFETTASSTAQVNPWLLMKTSPGTVGSISYMDIQVSGHKKGNEVRLIDTNHDQRIVGAYPITSTDAIVKILPVPVNAYLSEKGSHRLVAKLIMFKQVYSEDENGEPIITTEEEEVACSSSVDLTVPAKISLVGIGAMAGQVNGVVVSPFPIQIQMDRDTAFANWPYTWELFTVVNGVETLRMPTDTDQVVPAAVVVIDDTTLSGSVSLRARATLFNPKNLNEKYTLTSDDQSVNVLHPPVMDSTVKILSPGRSAGTLCSLTLEPTINGGWNEYKLQVWRCGSDGVPVEQVGRTEWAEPPPVFDKKEFLGQTIPVYVPYPVQNKFIGIVEIPDLPVGTHTLKARVLTRLTWTENGTKYGMRETSADSSSLTFTQLIRPIPASVPIALLPVRLETRYLTDASGVINLCVRIYPDELFRNSHEPGLPSSESEAGTRYHSAADKVTAWRELVKRYGIPRAAWIEYATRSDSDAKALPKFGEHIPETRLLPQRWALIGYRSTDTEGKPSLNELSKPIRDPLYLGPSFSSRAKKEDIAWLSDFNEALKAGMAIQVPLTGVTGEALHFTRLCVIGVKDTIGADEGASRLEAAFKAHRYSSGLEFVPQGTPTNNTPDAGAGYASRPDDNAVDQARTRLVEAGPLPILPSENGPCLARALGLKASSQSGPNEDSDARHMNEALWASTWGYYLEQLLSDATDTKNQAWIEALREHFVRFVRARGPFSALRIGRQPYGFLPVSSLSRWKDAQGKLSSGLSSLLLKLKAHWLASVDEQLVKAGLTAKPPTTPQGEQPTPESRLAEMLQMDAVSLGVRYRRAMGGDLYTLVSDWKKSDTSGWTKANPVSDSESAFKTYAGSVIPNKVDDGFTSARITGQVFAKTSHAGKYPVVSPQDSTASCEVGQTSTIQTMLGKSWRELRSHQNTGSNSPLQRTKICIKVPAPGEVAQPSAGLSLLMRLLRHSTLLEYLKMCEVNNPAWRRECEFFVRGFANNSIGQWDMNDDDDTSGIEVQSITPWNILATGEKAAREAGTILQPRAAFKNSLSYLDSRPAEVLEPLLLETLDLCSHRLDAWITSLASRNLEALRSRTSGGIYLGLYGWVEDVRPGNAIASEGYVHTPSLNHANAAAILRSGYLAHADEGAESLFAVNLSSERVRQARWILEGVRQGRPAGQLLGYRFERKLREESLQLRIRDFRKLARTLGDERLDETRTVDGLKLWDMWRSNKKLVSTWGTDQTTAEDCLNYLNTLVDAIRDLGVAESVFQLVKGDDARAETVLEALSTGGLPPPDLQVADTPREGLLLEHRVLVLLSPEGDGAGSTPRSSAEPTLHKWLETQLPPPSKVQIWAELRESSPTGTLITTTKCSLQSLLDKLSGFGVPYWSSLDLVCLGSSMSTEGESRLAGLLRLLVWSSLDSKLERTAPCVVLQADRDSSWGSSTLSLPEYVKLMSVYGALLKAHRPLTPEDLVSAGQKSSPSHQVDTDLQVSRARGAFRGLQGALNGLPGEIQNPSQALKTLLALSLFGGKPVPGMGADAIPFLDRLQAASREALTEASGLNTAATSIPDDQVATACSTLLFAGQFTLLPTLRSQSWNTGELQQSLRQSSSLLGNNTRAPLTWLRQTARVSAGVSRLNAISLYAQALGAANSFGLYPAQLPLIPGDPWMAMKARPPEGDLRGRTTFLIHSTSTAVRTSSDLTGLWIDGWSELLPSPRQTTGVAFHYDRPDATAPQSVLLAVPADPNGVWTFEELEETLRETLELARIRMIDPATLGYGSGDNLGQFLPALHFAFNEGMGGDGTNPDTISTDFR